MATCPRCGSTVRHGSDWCTLCFADLRPVPPRRAAPDPLVVSARPPAAMSTVMAGTTTSPAPATTVEADVEGGAVIACTSCGEPVTLMVGVCGTCGAGLFDKLKQDTAHLVLPVIGDVMRFGKGARAGLAIGFAVLFIVLLFTVITILGHVV